MQANPTRVGDQFTQLTAGIEILFWHQTYLDLALF